MCLHGLWEQAKGKNPHSDSEAGASFTRQSGELLSPRLLATQGLNQTVSRRATHVAVSCSGQLARPSVSSPSFSILSNKKTPPPSYHLRACLGCENKNSFLVSSGNDL